MKNPGRNNRRHFLRTSTWIAAGAFAAGSGLAAAAPAPRRVDPALAAIVHSYGTTLRVVPGARETVRMGSRSRRLPVTRLEVDVRNREAFQASFHELTRLSERVMVDGNAVRVVREGTLMVIDNRVAS